MKIEVNSSDFAEAVSWAAQIIPSRPTTPILAGIKIEASEGQLQLSTFDYDQSARLVIAAQVDEPGIVIVHGKLLSDIARNLPGENASLETSGTRLHITSGKSSFQLQLMPQEDYPQLPSVPTTIGRVDGKTFIDAINQANVSIARDQNRPVLTGIHIQINGETVTLSSTDRFRLSRTTFTWSPASSDVQADVIVRGEILRAVVRSVDAAQNVTFGMDEGGKLISFDNAGKVMTVQLTEGQFPAVDRLFADEYPIEAVLDRRELMSAISRAALVTEHNAAIRLEFENNQVSISAGTADESQAHESLNCNLTGEPITVAFNPTYLKDGLSVIPEPYVRMRMQTSVKAVEFNGQQEMDDDTASLAFRYLLVPMRF